MPRRGDPSHALRLERDTAPAGRGVVLPAFVRTPTAKQIISWIELVHSLGDFGVLRGRPGTGKTSAAREYARLHVDSVWMIVLDELAGTKSGALRAIADAAGIAAHLKQPHQLLPALKSVLKQSAARMLIILDEAQYLTRSALSIVRALSDSAGCGVFLSGNHTVLVDGRAGPGTSRLSDPGAWVNELSQIKSRVGVWQELLSPTVQDVLAYSAVVGVPRSDEAVQAILWAAASRPGGLRNVEKILKASAALEAEPLSADALERAWELTGMNHKEIYE